MKTGTENIIMLTAGVFLLIAFMISLFRLVKGPTINDRIAALDLIASIAMGFILVFSISSDKSIYFDVAIAIALVSFMGTVGISTYLRTKS
jgi:multicomponent Na+:H+ antiporter subunit F